MISLVSWLLICIVCSLFERWLLSVLVISVVMCWLIGKEDSCIIFVVLCIIFCIVGGSLFFSRLKCWVKVLVWKFVIRFCWWVLFIILVVSVMFCGR